MGKEPAMSRRSQARVSVVACHPKQDVVAAGYADGTVLMVRIEDGAEILVRRKARPPVARLPGTPRARCWRSPTKMGTAVCWSFKLSSFRTVDGGHAVILTTFQLR